MKGDTISRSALLEKAWDADTQCGYVQVVDVGDVEEASAVEPEPEVHGRWVKGTSCDIYWNYCSICGGKILKNEYQQDYFSDYCPFCGARMDGGE